MELITKELLRSWNPCAGGYKRFCELFPNGTTLTEAIDGLAKDGHEDWAWWLFSACRRANLFTDVTSRGYGNSGNRNSGDGNSGNWNSGDVNSGDGNSGDRNSGDRNSGNWNSGDRNSGNRNSGNWNSGNRNSGNGNSGNWNSGNWNSGNWNSGNWNSGDRNSGFFNIDTPAVIRVFGKECPRTVWDRSYKPSFLQFSVNEWVGSDEMTEQEKAYNPLHVITGGIARNYTYREAFQRSWDKADPEDRMKIKDLPNFDAEIFFQISGIDLRED